MSAQTQKVDVLAVMDYHAFLMQNRCDTARSVKGHENRARERDDAKEARAAVAELIFQLRGCRDMLRESAKQHRINSDIGHANMADLKANDATAALAVIAGGAA